MSQYIMQADILNLPEKLAKLYKGRKVKLIAKNDTILIQPINSDEALKRLIGIAKSDGHSVDRFIENKQEEIALEEEQSKRRNEYFTKNKLECKVERISMKNNLDKYRAFTLIGALIWLLSRVLRNTFLMDYELIKNILYRAPNFGAAWVGIGLLILFYQRVTKKEFKEQYSFSAVSIVFLILLIFEINNHHFSNSSFDIWDIFSSLLALLIFWAVRMLAQNKYAGKITIKKTDETDLLNVMNLWNNGETMKYVGFPGGFGINEDKIKEWYQTKSFEHFSIYSEEEDYCGETGYHIDNHEDENIGLDIKLLPHAQGKGIAEYALRYVIEQVKKDGKGRSVWVDPDITNEKAIKLYKKLGFKEKVFPKYLAHEDDGNHIYMELLIQEYQEVRK
ncbi:MAG: GNAT family N-acetyltransferase [Candidatus Cloacimonetes bacterium]|nr:GNAT family N-acetyltransferase [Candidatus Cloacimonadota bacterium]